MIGLAAGGRPQQAIAWRRRRACLLYGRQQSWNGHVELKRSKLSIASVQVVTWLDAADLPWHETHMCSPQDEAWTAVGFCSFLLSADKCPHPERGPAAVARKSPCIRKLHAILARSIAIMTQLEPTYTGDLRASSGHPEKRA